MSKTFYANGSAGKMAIMDGELDLSVINNPLSNIDKLYFHNSLDYLYKIGSVSGVANYPSLNGSSSWVSLTTVPIGTLAWNDSYVPIIIGRVNGVENNGSVLVQKNSESSFRFVSITSSFASGVLTIAGTELALTGSPLSSINVNISADIYTFDYPSEMKICDISTDSVQFGNGRFRSDREYLRLGTSYHYANYQTIELSQDSFQFLSSFSNLGLDI
ncbi:MAG: hypothetical protein AB7F25_07105 [Deferribacterales bacterium]